MAAVAACAALQFALIVMEPVLGAPLAALLAVAPMPVLGALMFGGRL